MIVKTIVYTIYFIFIHIESFREPSCHVDGDIAILEETISQNSFVLICSESDL